MLTTQKEVLDIALAWQGSRALLAAVELNLFSTVGEGSTAAEIAERVGTDTRCTERLLNVMVTLDLMSKQGEVFINGPAASQYLVPDGNDYLSMLHHTAFTYRNWGALDQAVRAGTSTISTAWDSDEHRDAFIEAMHRRSRGDAENLVNSLDLSGVDHLLDVGGGSGAYSIALCQANKGIKSTVLDLPGVTQLTRKYVAEAGLSERIGTREGSYLETEFGAGYDLVLFSAIVHINSEQENQFLMHKAFEAVNPGGVIAVHDFIMSEDRLTPAKGAMFALNMIVNTRGGDTYTKGEISGWLMDAGCETLHSTRTGEMTSMLTARKPLA
ncbi:putative O-methyltransferase, family 2 [Pseudodesulfovibrio piezophilus C1TLV30]|uniref:Putative O-methyltransferase, family 2 n=2 Tax=Pseudodesulfovibrio TaxID=2035811 RepID=M1WQT6_PSEP2|nr:putative O-methyltransferase, family 2 [Pseudodesulfovibrio piezophilus C1TLV30]